MTDCNILDEFQELQIRREVPQPANDKRNAGSVQFDCNNLADGGCLALRHSWIQPLQLELQKGLWMPNQHNLDGSTRIYLKFLRFLLRVVRANFLELSLVAGVWSWLNWIGNCLEQGPLYYWSFIDDAFDLALAAVPVYFIAAILIHWWQGRLSAKRIAFTVFLSGFALFLIILVAVPRSRAHEYRVGVNVVDGVYEQGDFRRAVATWCPPRPAEATQVYASGCGYYYLFQYRVAEEVFLKWAEENELEKMENVKLSQRSWHEKHYENNWRPYDGEVYEVSTGRVLQLPAWIPYTNYLFNNPRKGNGHPPGQLHIKYAPETQTVYGQFDCLWEEPMLPAPELLSRSRQR